MGMRALLIPVLLYGNEAMMWKEKKSRIRAVQMDNLRGLSVEYKERVPKAWIRELCRVEKGVD